EVTTRPGGAATSAALPVPSVGKLRACGAHRRGGPPLHLLGRHVLDVSRDVPDVAEGVLDPAAPVAVELVFDGPEHLGPRGDGPLYGGVDVGHVDHDAHGRAADRPRALHP